MSSENTENNIIQFDLRVFFSDFLREAKRLLWIGILLIVVVSVAACLKTYRSYTPKYQASASFTVYVTNPLFAEIRTYNSATAEQMAKTFPYILTSGALNELVQQELGISAMPGVSASVLQNTNIFTLTVTSGDPQLAYDVLNAVITYYPSVAEFVVGPTSMNLLDESGVPTAPINSRDYVSAVKKGALIGFAIWFAVVLLFAYARSTIHNESELKQLVNLNCIGMLPLARGGRKGAKNSSCPILTEEGDTFGFGESVRLMRIRIEKEMRENNGKVLLVSSAIPGEGKTTVASNLAVSFAQKGKRVLLVDCDLRNPSVAKAFGKKDQNGLSAYLKGAISAKQIIHPMDQENLFAVFGGTSVKNSAELLAKKEAKYFIDAARKLFDYVILDTPPCSMMADASEATELADCLILTIRQDFASKDQILEGAQLLADSGLPLIGCVLNCVKRSALGGAYGYYGYGYGTYYSNYGAGNSGKD